MQRFNILEESERVKAPEYFEKDVMRLLHKRQKKRVRARTLRFSLAGAFSAVAVVVVVISVFFLPQKGTVEFSGQERSLPERTIPIIEAVDYPGEFQSSRQEPPTIYILEQCSDETSKGIKF